MDIFRQTHRVRYAGLFGVPSLERVCLPCDGGLYDQPARDMEALEVLEATANAVWAEQAKKRPTPERSRKPRRRGRR